MGSRLESSEIVLVDPATVSGAPLIEGYRVWQNLRGARPYPSREELTPRRICGILSYMSLVKVIDGGADFLHRIVGDAVVQAFSVPIQNRAFSEIAEDAPQLIDASIGLFRQVVLTGAPLAWRQHTGRDTTHIVFTDSEVLLLPLGGANVDHVLGFAVHHAAVQTTPSVLPLAAQPSQPVKAMHLG